jgi:hypothetical protein
MSKKNRNLIINISLMLIWPLLGLIIIIPVLYDFSAVILLFNAGSIMLIIGGLKLINLIPNLIFFHILCSFIWLFFVSLPVLFKPLFEKNSVWWVFLLCSVYSFIQSSVGVIMILGGAF